MIHFLRGDVALDASFNQGGDTVRLPGEPSDYFGRVEGSRFIVTGDGFAISIPLGPAGIAIEWEGFSRLLAIGDDGVVRLGTQDFDGSPERIDQGPPVAGDDEALVDREAGPIATGNVLDNDVDPDGGTLTVASLDGAAVGGDVDGLYGVLRVESDGRFTYRADTGVLAGLGEGESLAESFTYTVADGNGGSDTGILTVTLIDGNAPPQVSGFILVTSLEDGPVRIVDGLTNVTDPEGDSLTIIPPDDLPPGVTFDAGEGTFRLDPSHPAHQILRAGEPGGFRIHYQVSDGTSMADHLLAWEIEGTNDPAQFSGALSGVVREDTILTAAGQVGVTDIEPGEAGFDPLSDGIQLGSYGTFDFNALTGLWTYDLDNADPDVQALDAGDSLVEAFTIRSLDGTPQTILVTIEGSDDRPVSVDDFYTTTRDAPLTVTAPGLFANDSDPNGDAIIGLTIVTGPSHGALAANPDGSFTYTPNVGFSGIDTFSYRATDDGTTFGNVATVSIEVSTITVVTFDDIAVTPAANAILPTDYIGFRCVPDTMFVPGDAGVLDPAIYGTVPGGFTPSGYEFVLNSGTNVAYTRKPLVISRIDGEDFDFQSGFFTAAWNDGLSLEVIGYRDGVIVATLITTLPSDAKVEVIFPSTFDAVDEIRITPSGGTPNPDYKGFGEYVGFDDLVFG